MEAKIEQLLEENSGLKVENSGLNERVAKVKEKKSRLIPECPVTIKLRL